MVTRPGQHGVAPPRGGSAAVWAALLLVTLAVGCQRWRSEVVVYTSEDQVFSEPILKDFEKTSGIRVRAVFDTEETKSTGVALRIVAERAHPQADGSGRTSRCDP